MASTDVQAVEFVAFSERIVPTIGADHAFIAVDLRRSSREIERSLARAEAIDDRIAKLRTLGAARGKAMRCAALLDVLRMAGEIDAATCREGMAVLEGVVPTLTRMIGGLAKPGSGGGAASQSMLRRISRRSEG